MNYIKQEHQSLIDEFFNLSPLEFTLIGNVFAYFLASVLSNSQQNSLGNLFELIAQVLLTIQAQTNATDIEITEKDVDRLIYMLQTNSTNKESIINLLKKIKQNQ